MDMYKFEITEEAHSSARHFDKQLMLHVEKQMTEYKLFKDRKLTLDSLAAMIGVTRAKLSRAINKMTGHNFVQYVNSHRIREAIRIILEEPKSARTLDDICQEVGFSSQNPFYKSFKHITGVTPAEFRGTRSCRSLLPGLPVVELS